MVNIVSYSAECLYEIYKKWNMNTTLVEFCEVFYLCQLFNLFYIILLMGLTTQDFLYKNL